MLIFFSFFLFFIFCSCLGIIISKNPIYSILYLVIIFINVTAILLLFQVEFLGILFLIVYLGAIVILFLFIIMFLNIKLINLSDNIIKYTPFTIFFLVTLFLLFFLLFDFYFVNSGFIYNSWYLYLYQVFNLEYLGNFIFNYFSDYLYIAAILLFVGILGIVCLTLKIELDIASKRQNLFLQLRDSVLTTSSMGDLYKRIENKNNNVY